MREYQEDNPKDRLYGTLAACAAYMLIAFLITMISISIKPVDRSDMLIAGGVMLDLGADEQGFGEQPVAEQERAPKQSESDRAEESRIEESELAVNNSDSTASKPKEQVDKPIEVEQPKVNKDALFPGMGSDSGKGTDEGASGTTGSTDGTAGGSGSGGNTSGFGNASLAGRSLSGSLPAPSYNVNSSGRVVVEVRVNQKGVVESAVYKAQGSTTTDTSLVRSAIDAAKKARFNIDESAPITQIGTITYNFKLE